MPTRLEEREFEQALAASNFKAQDRQPYPYLPPLSSSMRTSQPSTAPSAANIPPTPDVAYSPSLVGPTYSTPSSAAFQPQRLDKYARTPTTDFVGGGSPAIRSPGGSTPGAGGPGWDSTGSTVRRELEHGLDRWDGPQGEYRMPYQPPTPLPSTGLPPAAPGRAMVGSSLRFQQSSGRPAEADASARLLAQDSAILLQQGAEADSGSADRSTSTIKPFSPTNPVRADAAPIARDSDGSRDADKTSTLDTSFDTTRSSVIDGSASVGVGASRRRSGQQDGSSSIQTSHTGSSAAVKGPAGSRTTLPPNGKAPLPNFTRKSASASSSFSSGAGAESARASAAAAVTGSAATLIAPPRAVTAPSAPRMAPSAPAPTPRPVSVGPAQPLDVPSTIVDGAEPVKKARPKPKPRLSTATTPVAIEPALEMPRSAAPIPAVASTTVLATEGSAEPPATIAHVPAKRPADAGRTYSSKKTEVKKMKKKKGSDAVPIPPTRSKTGKQPETAAQDAPPAPPAPGSSRSHSAGNVKTSSKRAILSESSSESEVELVLPTGSAIARKKAAAAQKIIELPSSSPAVAGPIVPQSPIQQRKTLIRKDGTAPPSQGSKTSASLMAERAVARTAMTGTASLTSAAPDDPMDLLGSVSGSRETSAASLVADAAGNDATMSKTASRTTPAAVTDVLEPDGFLPDRAQRKRTKAAPRSALYPSAAPAAQSRVSPRKAVSTGEAVPKQTTAKPSAPSMPAASAHDPDATESEADEIRMSRPASPAPAPPPKTTSSGLQATAKTKASSRDADRIFKSKSVISDSDDSDELTPVPSLSPRELSPAPRRASAPAGKERAAARVKSDDEDVPVAALVKRRRSTLTSSGTGPGKSQPKKKRRVAISSDEEDEEAHAGDDDEAETEVAPGAAAEPPAAEPKKAASKASKNRGGAAAEATRPALPSALHEIERSRGLESQPMVAALIGETTDAETTMDDPSPVKRGRTKPELKGKGKKVAAEKDAGSKKVGRRGRGKGANVVLEAEEEAAEEETEGDENVAPPPAPKAPSSAKAASPIKRVAAASATSSARLARHGTPSGPGVGVASTPSYKIPRHLPPFKDGRGRAGSVGGVGIPPALGLAARPLSRLGSETPSSGIKLNAIVSRTAHLVVGTPAGADQTSGAHATPSPSAALKSRVRASGLSKRGIARTPLLTAIAPAPKRLGAAPVEKKRPKKSDLNPDDFSDGEWEEMEKERKRKEREWDSWD